MAHYVILDSTANLVESFDDEDEARAVLEQMAQQDPDEARDDGGGSSGAYRSRHPHPRGG